MIELLKSTRAKRIYFLASLSLAVLCAILRTLSTIFFFEADVGYYKSGALLPILLNILLVLCAVCAAAFCLIPGVSRIFAKPEDTKAVRACAVFAALGFLAFFANNLRDFDLVWETIKVLGFIPKKFVIRTLLALLSAVFFLLIAFCKNLRGGIRIGGVVITLVWTVLTISDSYFDVYMAMNSPVKLTLHAALLGMLLLLVNEARVGIGSDKKAFSLFSSTVTLIFATTSSIPSIISYLCGKLPDSYSNVYAYLFFDAVLLGIAVFSAARLASLCFGTVESETVESETVESETVETEEYVPYADTQNTENDELS